MRVKFPDLFATAAFLLAANGAAAQELGDAKAGLRFAGQICAECHAVKAGERASPRAQAPTFETIANASGMTAMALRVWFRTAHTSMPSLVLSEQNSDNVIAYILSLKKHS
jgi:mono/diheme cytochrome c family protein